MKDPASDFFLKHQPLEYYKCHLHTVLETEKGGRRRKERGSYKRHCGDKAETCGLNGMSLSEAVKDTGVRDMSHYKAD